jgi:formylglycine-generating enzyme required for sulfatase activity
MDISRRRFLLTTTLFSVGGSGAIISACGGGGTSNVSNTAPLTLAEYKTQMRSVGKSLKMGRTEVTWSMWQEYCTATMKEMPKSPRQYVIADVKPVVNVTWDDCNEYAIWAGLRLPTSAEWLLAATNGDGRNFPWGGYGGLRNNSYPGWDPGKVVRDVSRPNTMNVGSKPSGNSPFGCSDMAGNVYEWTATGSEGFMELRGGAAADIGSEFFLCNNIEQNHQSWSNEWIGFRLCSDV